MKIREQRQETRLTVRLPADLAAALRRLALAHERSLNAEVVWGLQDYVQRDTRQRSRKTAP